MAPAANTGKSRQSNLLGDSDPEADAYDEKLHEAEAARERIKLAKEYRNKRREALALAYQRSLSEIYSRMEKSIAKYKDLHSAMHIRRLKRLKKAVDTRDEKLEAICEKLVDLQQLMANHGSHLHALYGGRCGKIEKLVEDGSKERGGGGGGMGQAGGVA